MKFKFLMALAACATLALSCTEDGTTQVGESDLIGTWYMAGEQMHPSIVTFKANGDYIWEYGGITGLRDTGTYTITDNVVTFRIQAFWEIDVERGKDGVQYKGEWKKQDADWSQGMPRTRIAKIYVLEPKLLIMEDFGDWFYGDGMLLFMTPDGGEMKIDREISQGDLQGEWESRDQDGNLRVRLLIDGNNYTCYTRGTNDHFDSETGTHSITEYVNKQTGSFKVEGTSIEITYSKLYSSSKEELVDDKWVYSHADFDPVTLEATEWLTESEQGWTDAYQVYRDGANMYWFASYGGYAFKKK